MTSGLSLFGRSAAWVGALIGSYFGSRIDRLLFFRPGRVEGPRLEALRVQVSTYGAPIPRMWGRHRVAGNVIWISTPGLKEVREEVDQGDVIQIFYSYFLTGIAFGLCRGPIVRVQRIWADGQLIFNLSSDNEGGVGIEGLNFRLYLGDESQEPDPQIEESEGDGNVPAFRGLSYVVFENFPLERFGNHIPNFNFEIFTAAEAVQQFKDIEGVEHGGDTVLFSPCDGSVITQSDQHWYRVDPFTGTLLAHVEISNVPASAMIESGKFAFDDRCYIYTQYHDTFGSIRFPSIEMNSLNFDTIAFEVVSNDSIIRLGHQFVFVRSPVFPPGLDNQGDSPYSSPILRQVVGIDSGYNRLITLIVKDPYGSPIGEVPFATESLASSYIHIAAGPNGNLFIYKGDRTDPAAGVSLGTYTPPTNVVRDITSDFAGVGAMIYDKGTNQIIFGAQIDHSQPGTPATIAFFDAESPDFTFLGRIEFPEGLGGSMWSDFNRGTVGGFLYVSSVSKIYRVDVRRHVIANEWDVPPGIGALLFGGVYHPATHSYLQVANPAHPFVQIFLDRGNPLKIPLSQIVRDICLDVDLEQFQDFDVSELTDLVTGFIVNDRMPARSAIEQLMEAYFFDAVETDGVIKFVKRGASPFLTIPESELAAHRADDSRPQQLVVRRKQDLELPVLIEVGYSDVSKDYDVGVQSERRLISRSEEKASLSFALATDADEAKQIAVKQLGVAWGNRTSFQFFLSRKYAWLDPADVVLVEEGGQTDIVRIEEIGQQGGVLDIRGVSDHPQYYSSDAIGVPLPPPGGNPVPVEGMTIMSIFDTALFNDAQNREGALITVTSARKPWRGAQIFKAPEQENQTPGEFNPWDTVTPTHDGVVGIAKELGGVDDPDLWDEANILGVALSGFDDSLDNATKDEILNDRLRNLCVVGSELIQFRTATMKPDGSWELTGLLRGRFGTEWSTKPVTGVPSHGTQTERTISHASGEPFALLTEEGFNRWIFGRLLVSEFNFFARADSIGSQQGSGSVIGPFNFEHRSLMTLAPVHLQTSRGYPSPVPEDLTIQWKRRARIGGTWEDGGDVPLDEGSELYTIEIMRSSDGSFLRSIFLTNQGSATIYLKEQQIEDGITPGEPVDVRVFQDSPRYGGRLHGFAARKDEV